MPNINLGSNVFYFDTNGAINNGKQTSIIKIALWGIDTTSALVMAIGTGVPAVKLTFTTSVPYLVNQWQQCDFAYPGWYVNNASILSVTAGSGYVFIA